MSETRKPADNDNTYGLRDGEIAVELPARPDASLYFIGRIRTPWQRRQDCPKNARESHEVCTIEFDPRWADIFHGRVMCRRKHKSDAGVTYAHADLVWIHFDFHAEGLQHIGRT